MQHNLKATRKILVLFAFVLAGFGMSVLTVFAGSATYSSTIDTSDLPALVTLSWCLPNDHYEVVPFYVTETGTYSISEITTTGVVFVGVSVAPDDYFSSVLFDQTTYAPVPDGFFPNSGTLDAGTTYYLLAVSTCDTPLPVDYSVTISGPGEVCLPSCSVSPTDPAFTDGRINDYDTASPVAVFPVAESEGTALHIYSSDGVLLLVVSADQIVNAPVNPESNVIIAEGNGVLFSRIATGDGGSWQINAPQYNGKTYVLIFNELFASGGYTSYEE